MTTEERFEKIEAGIRDLIVVSRTVLNSVEELREAQKQTDGNLNALIQTQGETEHKLARLSDLVEKLVRYRSPNGQTGQ